MKVNEILIGLEHDNYVWTAKNPKQTLYVRIGKLAGVKKAAEGLYIAEGIAPLGVLPETIASAPIDPVQEAPYSSETPTDSPAPFSTPSEQSDY